MHFQRHEFDKKKFFRIIFVFRWPQNVEILNPADFLFHLSADSFRKVSQTQNLRTKIAFPQPILILGDSRTTGRVHGGSVTVYQKT